MSCHSWQLGHHFQVLGPEHWLEAMENGIDLPSDETALPQSQGHDSSKSQQDLSLEIQSAAVLTPTHAAFVPILLRNGTICLPLVTVLSRLGLKASPEKKVKSSGRPANRGSER